MRFPFSPKISTNAAWTRLAKLGYFYRISFALLPNNVDTTTHVVQTPISPHGASFLEVPLLADNRGNTARAEPGSTGPNQNSELTEELTFFEGRLDTEEVGEDTDDGEELVGWVTSGVSSRLVAYSSTDP